MSSKNKLVILLLYLNIFYLFKVKKGHIIFGQKFEIPIIVVQLPVETGLQNHDSLTRKSVIGHHFKVHKVAKAFLRLKFKALAISQNMSKSVHVPYARHHNPLLITNSF